MSKRDYYDVLGVEKDADDKAIKAAFRKLAMANHPDRNQGDNAAEEDVAKAGQKVGQSAARIAGQSAAEASSEAAADGGVAAAETAAAERFSASIVAGDRDMQNIINGKNSSGKAEM